MVCLLGSGERIDPGKPRCRCCRSCRDKFYLVLPERLSLHHVANKAWLEHETVERSCLGPIRSSKSAFSGVRRSIIINGVKFQRELEETK